MAYVVADEERNQAMTDEIAFVISCVALAIALVTLVMEARR